MSKLRSILMNEVGGYDTPLSAPECGSITAISELVCMAFTTRNLLHFTHWDTNSYAAHVAIGELYEDIISDIDSIVETYQGKFGILRNLATGGASLPVNIIQRIKDEAAWVELNRSNIAQGTAAIENLVDNLVGNYYKTVYKLENLK